VRFPLPPKRKHNLAGQNILNFWKPSPRLCFYKRLGCCDLYKKKKSKAMKLMILISRKKQVTRFTVTLSLACLGTFNVSVDWAGVPLGKQKTIVAFHVFLFTLQLDLMVALQQPLATDVFISQQMKSHPGWCHCVVESSACCHIDWREVGEFHFQPPSSKHGCETQNYILSVWT
jgi:hypothetical protein